MLFHAASAGAGCDISPRSHASHMLSPRPFLQLRRRWRCPLAHGSEMVAPLPIRIQCLEKSKARCVFFGILEQGKRLAARKFEQLAITQRVRNMETQRSVLARAEELARP